MALSEKLVKRLFTALTDRNLANELADAVNNGVSSSALLPLQFVGAVIATNVSQTVDFGGLAVGDYVLMIPATAGSADLIGPIATAGTLGQAAVVGNIYMVLRASLVAASNVKL